MNEGFNRKELYRRIEGLNKMLHLWFLAVGQQSHDRELEEAVLRWMSTELGEK